MKNINSDPLSYLRTKDPYDNITLVLEEAWLLSNALKSFMENELGAGMNDAPATSAMVLLEEIRRKLLEIRETSYRFSPYTGACRMENETRSRETATV
jgi:hypothetical protein